MKHRIRGMLLIAAFWASTCAGTLAQAQDTTTADLYRASYRLEAQGNATESLAKMKEIQSKLGAKYFIKVRLGWLAYLSKQPKESISSYQEAIALRPNAIEPRLGLTLPLLVSAQWKELDKACREVLRLDPNNSIAQARLAHALYSVGNYPDSATVYRKLVAEYPAELDHQTGLAWNLLKMGRRAEARQIFQEVLDVSPDNISASAGMKQ